MKQKGHKMMSNPNLTLLCDVLFLLLDYHLFTQQFISSFNLFNRVPTMY